MAGPGDIQRFPQGLLNVLGMQSAGQTPAQLAASIAGTLELLQFYGLTQRQVLVATNAAIATNTPLTLALTPPSSWGVLFGLSASLGETATIGNVQSLLSLQRGASGAFHGVSFYESLNVAAGGVHGNEFWCPYPLLLPPSSSARVVFQFTTDATASIGLSAEIGLLG